MACLSSVSVLYAGATPGPHLWEYTYAPTGFPLLTSASRLNPAGGNRAANTIVYNADNTVQRLKDAYNQQRVYTLGTTALVSVQDAAGTEATQYQQASDGQNRATNSKDALANTASMLYGDPANPYAPTQMLNRKRQSVDLTYDVPPALGVSVGNVSTITANSPCGRLTTTLAHDYTFPLGRVMSVTVAGKTPTTYTYDANGLVKTVTIPKPNTAQANGNAATVTTTYFYTPLGNVQSVQMPAPNSTAGATVIYTYGYVEGGKTEALGEPTDITAPQTTDSTGVHNHVWHYQYDGRGNVTAVIDALGNETDTAYNLVDQVTDVMYPATGQTGGGRSRLHYTYAYEAAGYYGGPLQTTTLFDENLPTPRLVRTDSRMAGSEDETRATSPGANDAGEKTTNTFTPFYAPAVTTDGKNNAYGHTYDNRTNLTRFTYPRFNASTHFDIEEGTAFDATQNLLTLFNGRSLTHNFYFASDASGNNADDRLTGIHFAAGTTSENDVSYLYDAYGRVTQVSDNSGTYQYTYDDDDDVLSEITTYNNPAGNPLATSLTIDYTYNNDGSRASLTVAGSTFTYTYDAAGRLLRAFFPWSASASATYQDNDWLKTQTLSVGGHSILSAWTLNAQGQTTSLSHKADGIATTTFSAFTYDGAGNLTGYTQATPRVQGPTLVTNYPDGSIGYDTRYASGLNGPTTWLYDGQNRLQQENSLRAGVGSGGNNRYLANYASPNLFASDDADNLTTLRGTALTYNEDNQLMGGTPPAAYDGAGNLTAYLGVSLTWDAQDRLVNFNSGTFSFAAGYRADGLRAYRQASTATTYFLYDGGHVVGEFAYTASSNSLALASLYGWGAVGLAERRAYSGDTYAYTFDPLGNLVQRHSASGLSYDDATYHNAILADYTTAYDAFGAQLGAVDTGTGGQELGQDAIGWGGQWGGYTEQGTTAKTGANSAPLMRVPLVLCGFRYYDPSTGRFLSRDPAGMEGGVNLYAYTRNNPVNFSDPMGLDWLTDSSDFFAGWGDALTFGGTAYVRRRVGADSIVNKRSGYYFAGAVVGTVHQQLLFKYGGKAIQAARASRGAAMVGAGKAVVGGERAVQGAGAVANASRIAGATSEGSAPLRGWIAKSLYGKLADRATQNALRLAFEEALGKGAASKVGTEGIKKLSGNINGYAYELKILSQGQGKWRLLGNIEQIDIPAAGGGVKRISVVVFRQLISH